MNFVLRPLARSFMCTAALLVSTCAALAAPDAAVQERVESVAKAVAKELAALCPLADPGSSTDFDACRQSLFRDSELKRNLSEYVLWGRQRDPKMLLKNAKLTQFAPDVLTGMYLPLFMFDGTYSVVYVEADGMYQIRLRTAFRNRLSPAEFPYPFWHEAEKWAMYEKANEVLLFWDAQKNRIKFAQFTVFGTNPPLIAATHVERPAFNGQWTWTDANGKTQPKVTVFDGLFRSDNPYIEKLDVAYKRLALRLRDGQCDQCHVPNNPDGMKKLVLLQTPMHTASEIKRVLKSVRDDRMPRDEFGIEQPLDAATKSALLNEGVAFDQLVDAAKLWEANRSVASAAREPRQR